MIAKHEPEDEGKDKEPFVVDPIKLQVASLLGDDFDYRSITQEQLTDLEDRIREVEEKYGRARNQPR